MSCVGEMGGSKSSTTTAITSAFSTDWPFTVDRYGWEMFSFVIMPNHFHVFLRTPQPNLSRGMQYLASGYANWYAKRHRRPGHLLQGRFNSQLVEDETYFWSVSRYIHLNPVRGKSSLVSHPREWRWSSYPGYGSRRARFDWIRPERGLARPGRTRACPQLAGSRPLISTRFIAQWPRTMGSTRSRSGTFVPSPSAETLPHGCHAN
jgi:REP element-mobilizing transposase RayT